MTLMRKIRGKGRCKDKTHKNFKKKESMMQSMIKRRMKMRKMWILVLYLKCNKSKWGSKLQPLSMAK